MIGLFRPLFVRQGAMALGLAAPLLLLALPAGATPTYTVQVTTNADLGVITSGMTGDSDFRIDPTAGTVTEVSGMATRSGSGGTRAMVTISCRATAPGDCTRNVNVAIAPAGAPIGRGRALTRMTYTLGTAQQAGPPGTPGSPNFTIGPIGANSSKTFYVGADFAIAGDNSGLPTGVAEADFVVYGSEFPLPTTGGTTGRFVATVIRSIAISKLSDLVFGTVSPPPMGMGSMTVDATTGARTTIGAFGFGAPGPSRAAFNVTGEGGQAFSVTVPATFQMTGPQTMTVTTSSSVTGSPLLTGALGSQGSFVFGVGGTAPINSTTPTGSYSGSFTVTVAYN
jgi:hypothetical protein